MKVSHDGLELILQDETPVELEYIKKLEAGIPGARGYANDGPDWRDTAIHLELHVPVKALVEAAWRGLVNE